MTELIAAPRIVEFPRITSPRDLTLHESSFLVAPLNVVHEWIAHEFGSSELGKVHGLPVSIIASLYPEVQSVVFFSAVRGTTILDDLQSVFDAMAKAVLVDDSPVLRELKDMLLRTDYDWSEQKPYWATSVEALSLLSEMSWVVREIVRRADLVKPRDGAWYGFHRLTQFICAPVMVKIEYRADYASWELDWKPVCVALGLHEVWVRASARIEEWGRR